MSEKSMDEKQRIKEELRKLEHRKQELQDTLRVLNTLPRQTIRRALGDPRKSYSPRLNVERKET